MTESSATTAAVATQTDKPRFQHWRLSHDRDNIIYAYLDRAGERVNSLSRGVLEEFEQLILMAETTSPRGLVLLSGKTTGFVFGADVREFEGFTDPAEVTAEISRVHDMFNRLENPRGPTVAAIEGYCLGGGLEMSLACDYRIAKDVPSTRLGFPEIQLGIFPGFGGSVRSVKTMGGLKAMELMLTSRQVSAQRAVLFWPAKNTRAPDWSAGLPMHGPCVQYWQTRCASRPGARPGLSTTPPLLN